jgi:carbamate kinase
MTILVAALGGNALLPRGAPPTVEVQQRAADSAAAALAPAAADRSLVLTHGNGPQVGLLALREEAYPDLPPEPLDVLGAATGGMIGYVLEQALANVLPDRQVATVLTRMLVDAGDPAFERPSKPIGPVYSEAEARALAEKRGWAIAEDGPHWRRVVPSPEPRRIIPIEVIRGLVEDGVVTVCVGGGGIPVVEDGDGRMRGVEAVVDKDLASALLAAGLEADALLLLTDVDAVVDGWGTPSARRIRAGSPAAMRDQGFAAGSMGPKVEAACRFAERTGGWAAIGRLDEVEALLAGEAGTRVDASVEGLEHWPAEGRSA